MEYLTRSLLNQMDSDDPAIAQQANEEWNKNGTTRYNLFQQSKKKLSKKLVYILENCHFFHDTYILEISLKKNVEKRKPTFDLVLRMQYDGYDIPLDGYLIHRDVRRISTSQIFDLDPDLIFGSYLYGELFLNEDKLWVHNFLFFKEDELNILCKKIEWIDK